MRACRSCGCTDEHACSDGCSWAEPDLCSSCQVAALAVHPLIRAPLAIELPMHTWMAVHGNLLLAMRHPDNRSGPIVEDLVSLLEGAFLDGGLLTEAMLETMHRQEDQAGGVLDVVPRIILPGA